MGGGRPKRPPRGFPGGPEETKIIFFSLFGDFVLRTYACFFSAFRRVPSLTQAFKEFLNGTMLKEELKTQLVKMVVTAALNEKKQAAFKKETLLVTDR